MLQPLQLKDVSDRYTSEISEMREFLDKSGLSLGTAQTLGTIVDRISRDRAFHRDLTSHIWVTIHRSERQISYSDLLGILAIAAAGTHLASITPEDDAHDLLRFLMAAWRSFDTVSTTSRTPPTLSPADRVSQVASERVESVSDEEPERLSEAIHAEPVESSVLPSPLKSPGDPRRIVWVASAVCLLVVLLIALRLHRRSTAEEANRTAPASPAVAAISASAPVAKNDSPLLPRVGKSMVAEGGHTPVSAKTEQGIALKSTSRESHNVEAPSRTASSSAPPSLASSKASTLAIAPVALGPRSAATVDNASSPSHAGRNAGAPASAIPASTLSKRLGSRSLPMELSGADGTAENQKYPRLLRRHPSTPSAASSADKDSQIAELTPSSLPALPGSSHVAATNPAHGVVRPVSLGIMAANVLYSPAPEYPAAASAAHVQGEVTVRAEIDRNGNVASARVISGPPLLRDVALDAVQRWRYRPYLASGKPISTSTTAIVDFQLQ